MRRFGALWAVMIGLAVTASATADTALPGRQPDTSIRATLSLLPARPWSADIGGFSAFDLKAIRSALDLDWPTDAPASGDDAWPDAVIRVMAHVSPPPRALTAWIVGDLYDYYADLGLNQAAIGAAAEMPVIGHERLNILVGDGLADAPGMTAALGPGTTTGADGTSATWTARGAGRDDLLLSDRLVAFFPDIVIADEGGADLSALENVAAGTAPSLAGVPIVDALLLALDDAAGEDEMLGSLFAIHPENIAVALGPEADQWPADAALPAYDMVAFALRLGADGTTSMIVLMYPDETAARAARDEMRARLPFASRRIDRPVDDVVLVDTMAGWHAVMITSDMAAAALEQRGMTTAYIAWIARLTRFLDMQLLGPHRPEL